jgi:hypothetical protein
MRLRNLAIAIGSLSLVATPIVAQAASAPARDASPGGDAEELAGGGGGLIIALLGLAAVVGAIIIAVEDDEESVSP